MRVTIVTTFLLMAGVVAHAAQKPDSVAAGEVGREVSGAAPLSQGLLLSHYFARHDLESPAPAFLTLSLRGLTPSAYVPATRFDAMLFGAGSAGALAMFIGAIGNTVGAFDEDTTWILTGAAAAAGAVYAGSRYRVRATLRPEAWSIPSGPPRSP